jgi:hypothetical protein
MAQDSKRYEAVKRGEKVATVTVELSAIRGSARAERHRGFCCTGRTRGHIGLLRLAAQCDDLR